MVPLPSSSIIDNEEDQHEISLMLLAKAACTSQNETQCSSTSRRLRFQVDQNTDESTSLVRPYLTVPPLFTNLTADTIKELWYLKEEIAETKRTVGKIIIRRQRSDVNTQMMMEDNDLHGLERHNIERHCAKKAAIKLVLLAQSFKFANAEYLRSVSEKCSAKARALALQQGYIDFLQIHENVEKEGASRSCTCLKRKHAPSDDKEEPIRKVRQNTI